MYINALHLQYSYMHSLGHLLCNKDTVYSILSLQITTKNCHVLSLLTTVKLTESCFVFEIPPIHSSAHYNRASDSHTTALKTPLTNFINHPVAKSNEFTLILTILAFAATSDHYLLSF